jgi:CDP-glucose 4,6-dehydratase
VEDLAMNPNFWHNKNVLITGHSGFKGSWLALWLQSLRSRVSGYSLNPKSEPNIFELANVYEGINSQVGDIRDMNSLASVIKQEKPEIIFHLAAQALVRYSYENPVETYSTNVMGLVNLLEIIRDCPSVKSVIIVTTDKCYENREWVWPYRENEAMGGFDPYSSSKACAELVSAAYRNSYFNPAFYESHRVGVATARAGNVIGGGDWSEDRLVPDIIRAINSGCSVKIRNPNSVRPWQHVLESLNGYLTLAESLYISGDQFSSAWNFGPNISDCLTSLDITKKLISIAGSDTEIEIGSNENQPHEAGLLMLDTSKARNVLGWKPILSIEQSLQWILNWNNAYKNQLNLKEVSLKQIFEYQNMIN